MSVAARSGTDSVRAAEPALCQLLKWCSRLNTLTKRVSATSEALEVFTSYVHNRHAAADARLRDQLQLDKFASSAMP